MEAAAPRITDPAHGCDIARGLVCNKRVRADGQRRCWCSCPSEHECACYDAARKQSFHGKPLYGSVALTQRVARGPEWRLNGAWLGPEQRYNAPASKRLARGPASRRPTTPATQPSEKMPRAATWMISTASSSYF